MTSWQYIAARIWRPLLLLAGVFLVAAWAFLVAEGGIEGGPEGYGDALWFCLVTVSTVGYGDIFPVTTEGRLVAMMVILSSLGSLGFLFSRIGEIVVEGKQRERLGMDGTEFEGHVVILGWSPMARAALNELLASGASVAMVCETEELLHNLRPLAKKKQLFLCRAEARSPNALELVNIRRARTVVCCDEDDTSNLVLALNVRRLNPTVDLVSSIRNDELRHSFASAGVDFVTNAFDISGRLIASAAFEPDVAHFLDDITSAQNEHGHDLHQLRVPPNLVGWNCGKLRAALQEREGPLLVVHIRRSKPGFYRPNPPRNSELAENDVLIFLSTDAQHRALPELLATL